MPDISRELLCNRHGQGERVELIDVEHAVTGKPRFLRLHGSVAGYPADVVVWGQVVASWVSLFSPVWVPEETASCS